MVYNVKRYKQMMANLLERQNKLSGGAGQQQKTIDFAKISKQVQAFDMGSQDVFRLQMKTVVDEEKIREFHSSRKNYYSKMLPKKGVFKTIETDKKAPKFTGMLTSVKVKP